jgi:hypothetical protein
MHYSMQLLNVFRIMFLMCFAALRSLIETILMLQKSL